MPLTCNLFMLNAQFFFLSGGLKRGSICLSKADRKSVIHPGMKPLIAVSEHENWIQIDKSICGSDPFTVDLREQKWGDWECAATAFPYHISPQMCIYLNWIFAFMIRLIKYKCFRQWNTFFFLKIHSKYISATNCPSHLGASTAPRTDGCVSLMCLCVSSPLITLTCPVHPAPSNCLITPPIYTPVLPAPAVSILPLVCVSRDNSLYLVNDCDCPFLRILIAPSWSCLQFIFVHQ